MGEYTKTSENISRTLDSNPKASKQGSISEILQAYKNRTLQRISVDEEELLQAKTRDKSSERETLQGYTEYAHRDRSGYNALIQGVFGTPQCKGIEDEELLQGKFDSSSGASESTVQREVKPNNTGLPDNLKSGIENLSGYSMDDVKVHYNSDKPAQLSALAYAQGTDIHVAPGQERHLPHEAWHVVQQMQGRVQPTMQLQGVKVSDSEGLEKEADELSELALSANERNLGRLQQGDTGSSAVQRKIGFEFETGNTFYWEGIDEETKQTVWYEPGRTKDAPMYEGDGFIIEGDTHSTPEIILDPCKTLEEAVQRINGANRVLEQVNNQEIDEESRKRIMDPEVHGVEWVRKTAFESSIDKNWLADAQATQGVALINIRDYLMSHLSRKKGSELENLEAPLGVVPDSNVRGLVLLIIQFVADFQEWDGENADEGPKNAQAFMARNAYSKMFNSMAPFEKDQFSGLFFDQKKKWITRNPVTVATNVNSDDVLIPKEYLDSDENLIENKLVLKEWIEQIIKNGEENDKMSPPQGWEGGNYGMGLLDVDSDSITEMPLMLFEYRETDNRLEFSEIGGKGLDMHSWYLFAQQEFDKAIVYDRSLNNNFDEEWLNEKDVNEEEETTE